MNKKAETSTDLNNALSKTLALILAGGRGSRLMQLTDHRSKPAVPIAGKFKIIDFPLSNCVNSGVRRIAVLTQYRSHTLNQHVQRGWNFLRPDFNEFIELWPAQQQTDEHAWYQGTADAVYQNLALIKPLGLEYILILAGDHVYKQDYSLMLKDHIDSEADLTVACIEVDKEEAKGFGIMGVDGDNNIVSFVEKPKDPPEIPGKPGRCLASMGIYIFNAQQITEKLKNDAASPDSSHDFGKDIIPSMIGHGICKAHHFENSCIPNTEYPTEPYWRDVGTLTAYWEANMDLTRLVPRLDLYDDSWPIRTMHYQRPAAKFNHNKDDRVGSALNSVVSAGCVVSGGTVTQSILFNNVRVNSYASINESVILPNCDIGRHCRLNRVVLDAHCQVPQGTIIGENAEEDAKRFYRNEDGIVLVTPDMLEKL
ncbi:glucose-1-phosphate adenylyltransferase [Hahella sp. CCB-MM4]|uniref:glucose-1-phosphate adenylyltransferase n=1 Tax=Hahella sp. (strain CCB-MM4) TaxID=1926491 RepID=UPI000B9C2699|nr:glucose-1-phosphate adenylyltransferase [Hahella sp. CCB-MM4]OZG72354.1 glucose-1-phosphate adenylyltransferase [Hahella sp. CCB-MM4]